MALVHADPRAFLLLVCGLCASFVSLGEVPVMPSTEPDSDRIPSAVEIFYGETPRQDVAYIRTDAGEQEAQIVIQDIEGAYSIPYIQPTSTLAFGVKLVGQRVVRGDATLAAPGRAPDTKTLAEGRASFEGLTPGEYTLDLHGYDAAGALVVQSTVRRLGVGTVIAAIGDSITEGYFGRGYKREDLDLHASDFPPESVSRDGRNFPQYAPTTKAHLPTVNCFESWMTDLNNLLAERWRQPVFIANEGWGGITSAGYLKMIREDAGWQRRMRRLRPQVWLIHLGVNDERAKVPAVEFEANMESLVRTLIDVYGANPERILVARPAYDYFEGAEPILRSYCDVIVRLSQRLGLAAGPDFFIAYAKDREKWYGADPVHPNVEGMAYMARLWSDALTKALPQGVRP